MAMADRNSKPMIRVDVASDTTCPWCFVGKKHLEQAIAASKDRYEFEVRWLPFFLDPELPATGVNKKQNYWDKFGEARTRMIVDRVAATFLNLGYKFSIGGNTGSTVESHRLIALAGRQGLDKQDALVEELFVNFFTQEKYIGDKDVLLAAAEKVGIQGAKEFLDDPQAGLEEVLQEERKHHRVINGVPHFIIDGRYQISGAQSPESFLEAFELSAKHRGQKQLLNSSTTTTTTTTSTTTTGGASCTRDGCQ